MDSQELSTATLKDIYEKVPSEHWGSVLDSIRKFLAAMKMNEGMIDIQNLTLESLGRDERVDVEWPETLTWVDDNESDVTIDYRDEDGDGYTLAVKKDKE